MGDEEAPTDPPAEAPAADAASDKPKGSFGKLMAAKFKYISAYSSVQTLLLYMFSVRGINNRPGCAGVSFRVSAYNPAAQHPPDRRQPITPPPPNPTQPNAQHPPVHRQS